MEIASKLFLELSQVVPAKTARELDLEARLETANEINTSMRDSLWRLSLYAENPTEANWAMPMSGLCIGIRDAIKAMVDSKGLTYAAPNTKG